MVGEQMQTQKGGLQSGCDDKKKRVGFVQIVDFLFLSSLHSLFMVFCGKKREGRFTREIAQFFSLTPGAC